MAEFFFSFTIEDYVPPFLRNRSPADFSIGIDPTTAISVDLLDDGTVEPSSIFVYVMGDLAYDGGTGLFIAPFSGSMSPTVVDGYNGYHLSLSSSTNLPGSTWITTRVVAKDAVDLVLDETWQFYTSTTLMGLEYGPYEITLDATFSSPMLLSTLLDASSYRLSNGAYVRYVEPIPASNLTPTSVRLWVEGLQNDTAFVLTVLSPPVMDASGTPLALYGRAVTFAPFQSLAFFSNTTGLVRSWRESRLMLKDSQRAYLVGIRGLDAFDITNSIGRSIRWSQVLDAYGAVAACLSGESDYTFSDVAPPFLGGRSPAPSATGVSKNTHIYLSVADETTSVEVTQLTIYLRNAGIPTGEKRIFSGANGWESPEVCGGLISVQRQTLNIHLIPKQPFNDGPVTVSITAVDLVGNLLSTSYTFTVGGGPVVEGGFGYEAFGVDPFGI
jgi:hypothetical protein